MSTWKPLWVASSLWMVFSVAVAQEASGAAANLSVSGYVSVVGGGVMNGTPKETPYSLNGGSRPCPCYIADWSNGGVYTETASLEPESRAGVQFSYNMTPQLGWVAQLTARTSVEEPELTWAYGRYRFNKAWEVQAGRKRIPLYYYSDSQDIGVAYPWVTPPPEIYGWEATNYNGASARYSTSAAGGAWTASVFGGSETVEKSKYWKIYGTNAKVSWNEIAGADVEVTRGAWTVRGVYLQAKVDTNGTQADLDVRGVAVNWDHEDWFVLSEITRLERRSATAGSSYAAPAATLGVGYRMGKWTPFINQAIYQEIANDSTYVPQPFRRVSATVRYDVTSSSAVKVQWDRVEEPGHILGGTATVLRIGYDLTF